MTLRPARTVLVRRSRGTRTRSSQTVSTASPGRSHPAEFQLVGRLTSGNWDPKGKDYNSLATWSREGDRMKIRLPWSMLGMADPSSRTALGEGAPAELVRIPGDPVHDDGRANHTAGPVHVGQVELHHLFGAAEGRTQDARGCHHRCCRAATVGSGLGLNLHGPDGELNLLDQRLGRLLGTGPVDEGLDDAFDVVLGQARRAGFDVLLDLVTTRRVDLLVEEEIEALAGRAAVAATGAVRLRFGVLRRVHFPYSPVPDTTTPRSRA